MQTRFTKPALFLVLIAAVAVTAGCRLTVDTDSPDRTINVVGDGEATISPDLAYASIGVQTRGADAGAAVDQNNRIAQAIADALAGLGVEAKDIQTSNFSIVSQEQFDEVGRPTGEVIYIVDNTVSVTVRDLSKVGPALDASVEAGANSLYGVTFSVEDDSAVLAEARDKAMADAKARAEQLARGAGAALGQVMNVSEAIYGYPLVSAVAMERGYGGGGAVAPAPVSPGTLRVQVQVSVTYELK